MAVKDNWRLDEEICFLNHGSFGACPRPVFEAYQRWQAVMQPVWAQLALVATADTPTTERLLKAFERITLTIVHMPGETVYHVTPLSPLQTRILELLGLSPAVYSTLATIRQT